MQLLPRASLLALLLMSPLACSSESDAGGTGGTPGTAGMAGSGGSTAGTSGAAAGGSGNSGGTQAGGSSSGGSSASGGTGGVSTGGAGGTAGMGTAGTAGSGEMAEQGKCERPEPIGSCKIYASSVVYCVAYYYDLGIDFKAECENSYNFWSDGGCDGSTAGWCELPGAPYTSTIEYYTIPAATQKGECEKQGNVWCEGKASLRPECAAGGDTSSDCVTCRAVAEASGGCCEAELGSCRADADCSAAFDCVVACTDTDCLDTCFANATGDAWLTPLACMLGTSGLDLGACGVVCADPAP